MASHQFFATDIHQESLTSTHGWLELNDDLEAFALSLAEEDMAGIRWCEENGYDGYTSYSSLDDLTRRASCFEELHQLLQPRIVRIALLHQWELRSSKIVLDNMWVNVLEPGGAHTGHVHPHCILSGTYYVSTPPDCSAIRFEDPRLQMMMAAPALRQDCDPERRRFVSFEPAAGDLLVWESWLRHEVPTNRARDVRISISFNFRLD